MRFGAMMGFALGSLLAAMLADAHDFFGPDTALYVYPVAVILGPLVGWSIGNLVDKSTSNLLSSAFYGSASGTIGPQHSPGDVLLQNEDYEAAADWFTEKYRSEPEDWRAQARLVEILTEHFDDEDRLAGEKNRLLHAEGVPEGLWCQRAMEMAGYWEGKDRPKRAVALYRMLLERYPDQWQADQARERLEALDAGGFPAAGWKESEAPS